MALLSSKILNGHSGEEWRTGPAKSGLGTFWRAQLPVFPERAEAFPSSMGLIAQIGGSRNDVCNHHLQRGKLRAGSGL